MGTEISSVGLVGGPGVEELVQDAGAVDLVLAG